MSAGGTMAQEAPLEWPSDPDSWVGRFLVYRDSGMVVKVHAPPAGMGLEGSIFGMREVHGWQRGRLTPDVLEHLRAAITTEVASLFHQAILQEEVSLAELGPLGPQVMAARAAMEGLHGSDPTDLSERTQRLLQPWMDGDRNAVNEHPILIEISSVLGQDPNDFVKAMAMRIRT